MRRVLVLPADPPCYAERSNRWGESFGENVNVPPPLTRHPSPPPTPSRVPSKKSVRFASDSDLCSYHEPSNHSLDRSQLWWSGMELSPPKMRTKSPPLDVLKKTTQHFRVPALDDELHERIFETTFTRVSLEEDTEDIFEETEEDIREYPPKENESIVGWTCRVPVPGSQPTSLENATLSSEASGDIRSNLIRRAVAAHTA